MVYFLTNDSGTFRGRGWIVLLRGLVAVAFGVSGLLARPRLTFTTVVLLFGIYAIVHGILSVAAAIGGRGQRGCLLLGVEGAIGLWAGIMALRTSQPGAMAFVFLVWLWAISTGVLRISEAIRLRRELPGDVWLALSGAASVLLGLILLWRRMSGGVIGLALVIAIPAVVWGICETLLGWELQSVRHDQPTASR